MSTIQNKASEELVVLVAIEVKAEKIEEFEKIFGEAIVKTREEEGVIAYNVYKNLSKANHYSTVEKYVNKAALDSHLSQDYFVALKHWLEDALVSPIEQAISIATEFTPA
jgi:quinol monooxygenase YgiN